MNGDVSINETTWDALVIGGGCAGSLAARALALRGRSVLLVDQARFPRHKVCGCCLNRRALAAFEAAGLGDLPKSLGGIPLTRFHVAAKGTEATIPLPGHLALSRRTMDAALIYEARRAGVRVEEGVRATGVGQPDGGMRAVSLRVAGEVTEARARVMIVADGLGGGLLKDEPALHTNAAKTSHIGAGACFDSTCKHYEPGVIYMACGRHGYAGLVRVEDGGLNVAAALEPGAVKGHGLAGAVAAILDESGFPVPDGLPDAPWKGTPALTRSAGKTWAEGVFLVGDAAGYVEPFTGEGMAWALTSGLAVAPLADAAVTGFQPAHGLAWEALQQRLVGSRQVVCRGTAYALRRPALVKAGLALARRMPALAGPLLRHMNAPPRLGQGVTG
jgi:menaquinone-9 beta-reductase